MIAPWLCKQQISQDLPPGMRAGIYYRLVLRQSLFGRGASEYTEGMPSQSNFFTQPASQACPGTPDSYIQCNQQSDLFLEQMMLWLQEGVAGASVFRADAALVVTWLNTASGISGSADMGLGGTATYQAIWMTDRTARLSYVILNYDKLGFDADDFHFNSRNGRCQVPCNRFEAECWQQALFNGGNHTGTVPVDPTVAYKRSAKILAQRSGVPHMVRGRYMFRVDDIVRPAGCSNKTGGTYPMLIYPNIVNMLGETTVDVNAMCLERTQTYVLMIEQRETATCTVLNPSIARCYLPRVFDWGTKTVYFQAQQGNLNAEEDKAFVGYIYFVPPTIDPIRLDIGNVYDWFKNPVPFQTMPISWYPRNFTNPEYSSQSYMMIGNDMLYDVQLGLYVVGYREAQDDKLNCNKKSDRLVFLTSDVVYTNPEYSSQSYMMIGNDMLYDVQLGLYVVGYREAQDDKIKKFRPEYRTLCRLATFTNMAGNEYRWQPQEERININQVEHWYLNSWERESILHTYRFGYMKLAPINPNDATGLQLLPGLVSSPISIHWLWSPPSDTQQFVSSSITEQAQQARIQFVQQKAAQICHDWYAEDGAQYNFIRYTETNASCPCVESQAKIDLGRFMPHPRCSQVFRDISCETVLGSQNCYLSAQNVYTSYYAGEGQQFNADNTSPFETHYGQVCCYDGEGKLMQSNYQPLVKVPSFSAFYHDYMPYYFCCKYAQYRCQLFYWRRPTSGCQQYEPPATGYVQGAGSFTTLDNQKFVFNEPGVFTLLHIPQTPTNPEVRIQIRLERYPNRRVDFGLLGRYLSQADLVQPTNATVVTGIALEATGTDRVVVVVRKDTRRFRYRTSIIVGNIIRYFDNMQLQKFKGVMIYVNNVEHGQAEVYVVLEAAQIGVRIRESYALDIARLPGYQESMGLLDVELSVPPRYGVPPNGERLNRVRSTSMFNFPYVSGLMLPNPEGVSGLLNVPLTLSEVNSPSLIQQLVNNYRIPGSGLSGTQSAALSVSSTPAENMFTTSSENDKRYEVFPEWAIKSLPIYKTAEKFNRYPYEFAPKDGAMLNQLLEICREIQSNPQVNVMQLRSQVIRQYGTVGCPNDPSEILSECADSIPCLYDYTMLDSKVLGTEAKKEWSLFQLERSIGSRQYNSCAAIMIEYPAYMLKTPAMAPAYLQGDVASFSCYQTHWIKGDYEYKCSTVRNEDGTYGVEWNKGWQPWCRSRAKDNLYQWITGIFATIGILMMIAVIFAGCWALKQRRRRSEVIEKAFPFNEKKAFEAVETEPYRNVEKATNDEIFQISERRSPTRFSDRPNMHDTDILSEGIAPASTELRSRRGAATSSLLGLNTSV
ncbi:Uncharacterized protein R09E10.5 [Toxocara canis]|uniref:Uncharacterized protein R09E10.5 n=1 Tax=Toxocara canis TaxID=6265 RepID=A0A0B2VLV5_TOXCA|nr:Uncharacterized protein R09E10.5 [Toxocara canis]